MRNSEETGPPGTTGVARGRGAKRHGRRRRGRERALQFLYQVDLTRCSPEDALAGFWKSEERGATDPEVRTFAERLVQGVRAHQEEIDPWIVATADHWRLERMSLVDRNVLRVAVYELLHSPETPAAVVIDEAVELAKRFGGERSASFVNGVLDAIRERLGVGAP
jgi:N utilization substance protein B